MAPRSWVRFALVLAPLLALGVLIVAQITNVRPAPQPTPIPTLLAADSETRVDLMPSSASRLYNFSATRLKLDARTQGFAFSAEIRDAAGKTIASFSNLLQDVEMTLAPNSGLYEITVSASDQLKTGTVSLALGSAVIAPQTLDGTALRAVNCQISNAVSGSALIRSAPGAQYAVLAMLPTSGSLAAIGRTDDNGWYTVSVGERQGWISGGVVALNGDCGALPVVRNPTIPNAPVDAQAFLVQADRDGSATFQDAISAPEGDSSDLIWVRIINLDTRPPNNYREFALTLDCAGSGSEALRWGSAYSPSLSCGTTIVLPFLDGDAQQPISVVLPPGSHQSYIAYSLSVLPTGAMG